MQPAAPLPVEVARKIRRVLYLDEGADREQRPQTPFGRLLWAAGRGVHWFLLVLAVVNLLWVFFDFSYMTLRPWYLRYTPELVTMYDPVKGVDPHRTTEQYIARARMTLRRLEAGDRGPGTLALVEEMRERSLGLYTDAPFSGPGAAGLFEQIKNRLRRHMESESAKAAFVRFWSTARFDLDARPAAEAAFFERDIAPLLHRNYFRRIGEDGQPYSLFWLIDLFFVPFFAAEFLLRGLAAVGPGHKYSSWKAYSYSHWADLIYFVPIVQYVLPFGHVGWIHLLRAFSVGDRMQRLGLINPVELPGQQISRGLDLITDLVSVRLLSNYQDSIRRFRLGAAFEDLTPEQRDDLREFLEAHAGAIAREVLPPCKPEIEELARHWARDALDRSPMYQRLRRIPFVGDWPERHLDELVAEVVEGALTSLQSAVAGAEHRRLAERLATKFGQLLLAQVEELQSEDRVKDLLIDLLEQQKQKLLA